MGSNHFFTRIFICLHCKYVNNFQIFNFIFNFVISTFVKIEEVALQSDNLQYKMLGCYNEGGLVWCQIFLQFEKLKRKFNFAMFQGFQNRFYFLKYICGFKNCKIESEVVNICV